jgi:hypothetical protein
MNLASICAAVLFLLTLSGSIYGMMRFLLKDITAAVALMDKHVNELRDDIKIANKRLDEQGTRIDNAYHVLLKRIKEE